MLMKLDKDKENKLILKITEETEYDKEFILTIFKEWKSFQGDTKDFTIKLN